MFFSGLRRQRPILLPLVNPHRSPFSHSVDFEGSISAQFSPFSPVKSVAVEVKYNNCSKLYPELPSLDISSSLSESEPEVASAPMEDCEEDVQTTMLVEKEDKEDKKDKKDKQEAATSSQAVDSKKESEAGTSSRTLDEHQKPMPGTSSSRSDGKLPDLARPESADSVVDSGIDRQTPNEKESDIESMSEDEDTSDSDLVGKESESDNSDNDSGNTRTRRKKRSAYFTAKEDHDDGSQSSSNSEDEAPLPGSSAQPVADQPGPLPAPSAQLQTPPVPGPSVPRPHGLPPRPHGLPPLQSLLNLSAVGPRGQAGVGGLLRGGEQGVRMPANRGHRRPRGSRRGSSTRGQKRRREWELSDESISPADDEAGFPCRISPRRKPFEGLRK